MLKNNERLAHAFKAGNPAPEDVQDQGFIRPSVLILLPFRSSVMNWITALTSHTPAPSFQVENRARLLKEYCLPEGAIDKLASAEPGTYPVDHVETFRGNVDDNFRLGIKLTRKSARLFAEFFGCDIIVASPLGLRMSVEKEKYVIHIVKYRHVRDTTFIRNFDFLSSIEILIVDQMEALTMQNWEHVQVRFFYHPLSMLLCFYWY